MSEGGNDKEYLSDKLMLCITECLCVGRDYFPQTVNKKTRWKSLRYFHNWKENLEITAAQDCTAGIQFWTKAMTPFWMLRTAVEKPNILR